jgi:segregation and condensation protein A
LLQLIERAELDITKLALAQVTDQFLNHINEMPESDAEEVSAFLVIAAKLIQIKSEFLLPKHRIEDAEDVEQTAEDLIQQLVTYKRFKEIAILLAEREQAGLRTYTRDAPPSEQPQRFDFSEIELVDILSVAKQIFAEKVSNQPLSKFLSIRRVTLRDKISHIAKFLKINTRGQFNDLLAEKADRIDIVVTFLAILELIKRKVIIAQQKKLFSEISIELSTEWDETEQFELEFGE